MKDLVPTDDDLTFEKILNALLDGDENLDLKTHINKPKQLAGLETISDVLKDAKCKESQKHIDRWTLKYLRYMVSFKRLSRTETIRAISEPNEAIKGEKDKFTKQSMN